MKVTTWEDSSWIQTFKDSWMKGKCQRNFNKNSSKFSNVGYFKFGLLFLHIGPSATKSVASTKENSPEDIKTASQTVDDNPDERSVFVKNVHFKASASELKEHFKECGNILRVTIPTDKVTSQPKG